jgi:hypothetical protein
MPSIEISETLWDRVSEAEKTEIIEHLRKHKYLMADETVVGNPSISEPTESIFDDIKKPACKLACDAAAAAAAAGVTLSGPAAAVAYAAIAVGRNVCRNKC